MVHTMKRYVGATWTSSLSSNDKPTIGFATRTANWNEALRQATLSERHEAKVEGCVVANRVLGRPSHQHV
jgi:hypothetical protein